LSTIRRRKDRALSGTEGSNEQIKDEINAHFFYCKGVVHKEFVPPGRTVNAAFYVEVLKRLKTRVARVRPEITWVLHHDNAPSHASLLVREFLAKQTVATLPQPPYSPDLAPPDFFFFPWLKSSLKGHHFGTVKNVQTSVTNALNEITIQDFQASYDAWRNHWRQCIDAQGRYFEEYYVCVNISSIKRIFSNKSHYFPDIPCIVRIFPNSGAFFHYFVMNKNEFIQADGGLSLHPAE